MSNWKNTILKHLTNYQAAVQQYKTERQNRQRLQKEVAALEEAQKIVQTAAAEIQNRVHRQIASVVTRALKTVFGENTYDFEIRFTKKRNKTEAQLVFCRNGQIIDPLDAAGGGVVDVAFLALRVACIVSSVPKLRRLVILDEPARHIHPDLRPVVLDLIRQLAIELNIQFLVVTHIQDCENLGHGKIIRLG